MNERRPYGILFGTALVGYKIAKLRGKTLTTGDEIERCDRNFGTPSESAELLARQSRDDMPKLLKTQLSERDFVSGGGRSGQTRDFGRPNLADDEVDPRHQFVLNASDAGDFHSAAAKVAADLRSIETGSGSPHEKLLAQREYLTRLTGELATGYAWSGDRQILTYDLSRVGAPHGSLIEIDVSETVLSDYHQGVQLGQRSALEDNSTLVAYDASEESYTVRPSERQLLADNTSESALLKKTQTEATESWKQLPEKFLRKIEAAGYHVKVYPSKEAFVRQHAGDDDPHQIEEMQKHPGIASYTSFKLKEVAIFHRLEDGVLTSDYMPKGIKGLVFHEAAHAYDHVRVPDLLKENPNVDPIWIAATKKTGNGTYLDQQFMDLARSGFESVNADLLKLPANERKHLTNVLKYYNDNWHELYAECFSLAGNLGSDQDSDPYINKYFKPAIQTLRSRHYAN